MGLVEASFEQGCTIGPEMNISPESSITVPLCKEAPPMLYLHMQDILRHSQCFADPSSAGLWVWIQGAQSNPG